MPAYKITLSKLLLSLLASLLVATQAQADTLFNAALWGRERGGELADGRSFEVNHYQILLPIMYREERRETMRIHLNLDAKNINWGNNVGDYYWLSAPFTYQQRRTGSTDLVVEFEPGIMTDLGKMDLEILFANLLVKGRTRLQTGLSVHYGLTVNREFGDTEPHPVLQLQWHPYRSTRLMLGLPETKLEFDLGRSLISYITYSPKGGLWKETTKDKKISDVSYKNTRLGVGAIMHWRKRFWLSFEVGQNLNREFSALNQADVKEKLKIKGSQYWQIGLNLRF